MVAAAKGLVPKVADLPEPSAPPVTINIIERGAPAPVTVASPDLPQQGEGMVNIIIRERKGP